MESGKKSHQNSTKPPKYRGLWVNFGGNYKAVARRQTGIAQILPGGLGEEASCKNVFLPSLQPHCQAVAVAMFIL